MRQRHAIPHQYQPHQFLLLLMAQKRVTNQMIKLFITRGVLVAREGKMEENCQVRMSTPNKMVVAQ
jgi:hypothetical protein